MVDREFCGKIGKNNLFSYVLFIIVEVHKGATINTLKVFIEILYYFEENQE